MAGSLVKIDEVDVTSTVSTVTIGNSNWDTSYDVYKLVISNATCSANAVMQLRVNVSSSPDTTSNYDYATKTFKTDGTFENNTQTNGTSVPVTPQRLLTGNSFGLNGILYIFNANNSSEYTFLTNEIASWRENSNLTGGQGGIVHTVAQAINGFTFYMDLGTDSFTTGNFKLYGLKK